jgi:hypothetical protein
MEGSTAKIEDGMHQPSILPTSPTDAQPIGAAGSSDQLGGEENSLFDKGLIETAYDFNIILSLLGEP